MRHWRESRGSFPLLRGVATLLAFVLFALLLLGCGAEGAETSMPLPRWSVQLPGNTSPRPVELPAHFDRELPRAPATYRLVTEVALPPAMQERALTLSVPHMPGIATLDANGFEAVPIDASTLIHLMNDVR